MTKQWLQPNAVFPTENASDEAVNLLYDDEASVLPTGRYVVRGGISWPESTKTADGIEFYGYAVLCAMRVAPTARENGRVYVVEETKFVAIDDVPADDNLSIKHEGLSKWCAIAWAKYRAVRYYWRQDPVTARGYTLQVGRSSVLNARGRMMQAPSLIKLKWRDEEQAMHTLDQFSALGRLWSPEGGLVGQQLAESEAVPDGEYPALHALCCALVAYDHHRYRKPA